MYSGIEELARQYVEPFRLEANRIWSTYPPLVPRLRVVAALYISLGNLAQGRKDEVTGCVEDMIYQSTAMGWYDRNHRYPADESTLEERKATSYTAWGVYNWI
ncbi:hypothetical protein BGZ63DRAFT_377828, partial [Mariannaea sp. PMI_226]